MREKWDGIISQHINRKFSQPLAALLAKHPKITPNMVTVVGTLVALASGLLFTLEFAWLGGILAQLSSIIDGVDGDLAKLTGRITPFGGFLDSILDRYADVAIFGGMTLFVFKQVGEQYAILLGLFAIIGSFLVSYTRIMAKNISENFFEGKVAQYLANRDVRLFVVMVGSLLSIVTSTLLLYTLLVIVAITTITIIVRTIEIYKKGFKLF
ncbi:MAG: CDP-alcohol phosphatidyltransferase family protein [Candidatus Jordarchaeum sp.]|uniref:CDP-alcohol phosphatidyltransferase family protein n=1 Tax=Candidatus Jordarchaeum sp. TaxID=2823881 RepID=UPI0040497934